MKESVNLYVIKNKYGEFLKFNQIGNDAIEIYSIDMDSFKNGTSPSYFHTLNEAIHAIKEVVHNDSDYWYYLHSEKDRPYSAVTIKCVIENVYYHKE